MTNRVDYATDAEKLEKRRITKITNPFGGEVLVNYQTTYDAGVASNHCPTEGTSGTGYSAVSPSVLSTPWSAPWDCYRVTLTSTKTGASSDTYGIYHKYLVDSVVLSDPIAGTPDQVFDYTYYGDPAWAYADTVMYGRGEGVIDYADYRGYDQVGVSTGSGDTRSTTLTQFFRGLDGSYRGASPVADVSLTPWGANAAVDDRPEMQGRVAATRTYDGDFVAGDGSNLMGEVVDHVASSRGHAGRAR